MKNILIVTYPFGKCGDKPIKLLEETGWNLRYSLLGRRLRGDEVRVMIEGVDAVIAGTETYNQETIELAKDLKVISRVGIGLDNVDYEACKKKGIQIAYTPEAPSDAVADLTVAQIINLLRGIHASNISIKSGEWKRITGLSIKQIKIGILGVGRIGKRVIDRLKPFGANILTCDIKPMLVPGVRWVNKDTLFRECDLVSVHIPMNEKNHHFVSMNEFSMMKEGSYFVNTSRGGVVNERDLEVCLFNHLAGAALDVFQEEPYKGAMTEMANVILTAHLASSDKLSRYLMELGAVKNCIQLLNGEIPKDIVMEKNYS